jgi:hypothetical protein
MGVFAFFGLCAFTQKRSNTHAKQRENALGLIPPDKSADSGREMSGSRGIKTMPAC